MPAWRRAAARLATPAPSCSATSGSACAA